ncbi:MAG TPA: TIM barrel protein [Anaerolineales bacterium]|nr:TIM barrel protein [Anaerolineales bacterium]
MALSFRFGTVGSPTNTPAKPGGSVGAIQHLPSMGLDALELAWVQSVRVTEATCAAIKAAGQAANVALSIHAPYFINLNATAEEWPKSRKRLMDAAHFGNLAGATDIIFHPGSYFAQPAEKVLEIAIPRLRGCVEELREQGNPATLRPETMGKSALLGSLSDTLAMAQAIPGVLPCVDISHLFARTGDGSLNTPEAFRAVVETIRTALGTPALQAFHIHISGIAYGEKGEKHHLMFAESEFRYRDFLQALAENGCGGRMVCECPVMEQDAQLLRQTWQSLTQATA